MTPLVDDSVAFRIPPPINDGGMIGTGGIYESLAKKGDSSGSVAESARPVLVVITEVLSGCSRNPRENRYSSLLASVIASSPFVAKEPLLEFCADDEADGAALAFVATILASGSGGGIILAPACCSLLEPFRFDDLRGTRGVRMLMEILFSRSARSASRSTMIGGACIRPLGILIGAGGPRRVEAVRGGGSVR